VEGWESRLTAAVERARTSAYRLGEFDCLRFACLAVAAVTGRDPWPEFSGYGTPADKRALLTRRGGTFQKAGDGFFGEARRIPVPFARRGDVAVYIDLEQRECIGPVVDHRMAYMSSAGLVFLPLANCVCAWRVG
jgi:hypothetical protein